MKLVDINILMYAVDRKSIHHLAIRRWWEAALAADEPIGLAWISLLGFLRLTTRPGVFQEPLPLEEAFALVDEWLAQPNVRLVAESDGHWNLLQDMLRKSGTAGNLTSDAHLAAIASSLGASIVSCDTDFVRFPHVRWENPLTSP